MRLIPAIDIIDGKCVRLTKGDYRTQKVYNASPLDVAKAFEDHGLRYVHVVDLDGAKSDHIVNHKVLRDIATKTSLQVDFGGGIKSDDDVRAAFDNGAHQVTAGSIAARHPERFLDWLAAYGSDRIILGADCMHRRIATHGWQEHSDTDVLDFIIDYEQKGAQYVICTDISKDGMLQGPATELYEEIIAKTGVRLIASGGISSIDDLHALQRIGCEGAIIGKAIYEGRIKISELAN
ncbi:1-(5-phosphoribosyl)-5-[(5-phosphoribosylamino)methylideneamino]imidazole-4-carboxamide isomerase [Limibacterium fermenti]|uniref:1-(5-phosphoribosyl)-5-[(5- phosphoribosylamino)methylideneamino]imidazole-4- carboxamide isomerase n=1 Tax=Limibacterium fermenti TaxID=3229863 RepID=UPI003A70093A